MRVLVTGGAGYIGSILVAELINEGYEINILDDLSSGYMDNIHPASNFIKGSILNRRNVRDSLAGCEAVIHLAAKSIVSESLKNPKLYLRVNFEGTKLIAQEARNKNIKKFLYSSSASVYGSSINKTIDENSSINPINPYGYSKYKSDKLLKKVFGSSSTMCVVFRFFNVAGASKNNGFKDLFEKHQPETHLIPNLLNKKAHEIFKINGNDFDTPDGTAIRDYIHVLDVVDAFKLGLSASQLRTYTILNLGTGLGNSVMDVITNYNRTFDSELKYKIIKKRKGDPPKLVTDNYQAKIELGWEPRRKLTDILNDYKYRAL